MAASVLRYYIEVTYTCLWHLNIKIQLRFCCSLVSKTMGHCWMSIWGWIWYQQELCQWSRQPWECGGQLAIKCFQCFFFFLGWLYFIAALFSIYFSQWGKKSRWKNYLTRIVVYITRKLLPKEKHVKKRFLM